MKKEMYNVRLVRLHGLRDDFRPVVLYVQMYDMFASLDVNEDIIDSKIDEKESF